MDYETDNIDYSVVQFYETFSLPKVVKVTQGFHGDITDDVFDINWVFRIHTTSSQKRVVARTRDHVYSIPLNYPYKMSVIKKNGKAGKQQTIKEVFQDHKLPVNIRFSSDQHLTAMGVKKSTNYFPVLTLVEEFDEIYMLANSLKDGRIYLNVVPIPLYLSKLRLAEVTGIKGQPNEEWTYFTSELSSMVSESVEFDTTYGNKDIAIFNEIPVGTEGSYSYLQPRKYTPLYDIQIFEPDGSSWLHKCQCSEHANDEFSGPERNDIESGQKAAVERKLSPASEGNNPLPLLAKRTNMASTEKSSMAIDKKSPPVPPKPKVKSTRSDLKSERIEILILKDKRGLGIFPNSGINRGQDYLQISSIIPGGPVDQDGRLKTGDILIRVNNKYVLGCTLLEVTNLFKAIEPGELVELEVSREFILMTDPSDLNTHKITEKTNALNDFDGQRYNGHADIKTKFVGKPVSGTTFQSSGTDKQTVSCCSTKDEEISTNYKAYATVKIDVGSLSIQKVGYYLKELRLSKYIPMFENERIDGVILQDLDIDIFMKEFGLSKIEARRLWRFAQDGHVPI